MSPATVVLVRLAADLVVGGLAHPVTAALARGSRMRTLAAPGPFAAMLRIDEFTLRRAAAGAMAFGELPAAYLSHLDAIEAEIDLVGVRSLARRVEGSTETRCEVRTGSGPVVVTLTPGQSTQGTGDLSHAG